MFYFTHLFFICLYVYDILSLYAIILRYPSTIHRQSIEHTSICWNATYSIIHMGSRRAVLLNTLILMADLNLLVMLLLSLHYSFVLLWGIGISAHAQCAQHTCTIQYSSRLNNSTLTKPTSQMGSQAEPMLCMV